MTPEPAWPPLVACACAQARREVPRPRPRYPVTLDNACAHYGAHPRVGVIDNPCVGCAATGRKEGGRETSPPPACQAHFTFMVWEGQME